VPACAIEKEAAVRAAFEEQAGWCDRLASPFTALLCRLLGQRLDRSTETGRKALDWPGNPSPRADALALRLCGGLNAVARSGRDPALAACYPPHPLPDSERLWRAVAAALGIPELPAWLDRAPQTNEVGRSAVLMSGLLVVADCFEQPLELLELGASAGLNLLLDRYGYSLGGRLAGNPDSPLRLAPDWEGPPPPDAMVRVASRMGVDIAPLDPRSDGDRLLAYVWPDQIRRVEQLAAALAIAAQDPPRVERSDAADWLDLRLSCPARSGVTRVVMHSVAFHYFPREAQSRIAARIALAGTKASPDAPLAWLRYEQEPGEPHFSLVLRVWPDGEEWRLAECHPHGRWIRWL
jgi:hypothetical protein